MLKSYFFNGINMNVRRNTSANNIRFNVKDLSKKIHIINIDDKLKASKNENPGFCFSHFQDFSSSTSLHGIQYLGDGKRSILERTWWLIMIILSIIGCSYTINKIWIKWDQSPVIVSFAENSMPVWQIPFPTVTICSEIKVRQTVFNFTKAFRNPKIERDIANQDFRDIFAEYASMICDLNVYPNGTDHTNNTILDFITMASFPYIDLFRNCEWREHRMNCDEIFSPIYTEDGKCFTFNILSAEELFRQKIDKRLRVFEHEKKSNGWSVDVGYSRKETDQTYPRRGIISGPREGLTFDLSVDMKDADYLCSDTSQGFRISLHSPADIPQVSRKHFLVPVNTETIVAIKPNMLMISDGLNTYDPNRKHCFLNNERKLFYFRIYTQQNCQLECLSNYTEKICGCVAFWMPRDENVKICLSGKKQCMKNAREDLEAYGMKYSLARKNCDTNKIQQMKGMSCDCLPGCTSINYDVETSQSEIPREKVAETLSCYKKFKNRTIKLSRVRLYFKDLEFIPSVKSELYGIVDFLANCGGTLGLFLGFSFLSLLEILYFITIGPVCNMKRRISKTRENLRKSWRRRRHLSSVI